MNDSSSTPPSPEPVYIPLVPGTKRPAVKGWADSGYRGIPRGPHTALRCDGLLIIDADSEEATEAGAATPGTYTPYTVRTRRGRHSRTLASPSRRRR